MIRCKRPPEPEDFSAAVASDDQALSKAVAAGIQFDFDEHASWRSFKDRFRQAQVDRCGFCESPLHADRYRGDVEHFRPKARVDRLQFRFEEERRVRGRVTVSETGYWWLAYSWKNLLLACNPCNKFKGNFFPVAGDNRELVKGCECEETPLLLHVYEGPEPREHLRFDAFGQISSRSGSE